MLLAIKIVLIKLKIGKKKLAQYRTLKLKVSVRRKGTTLNVNHRFIYIFFPGAIKCKQLKEARIKAVRTEPFDKKGSWQREKKSRRTLLRNSFQKNVREGDITPAISTSQQQEVPLQANFIDEN